MGRADHVSAFFPLRHGAGGEKIVLVMNALFWNYVLPVAHVVGLLE